MMGYAHSSYAESLKEFGEPLGLPLSGGWVLKRRIPGFADYDAMGCYPIYACQDWKKLHLDLEQIGKDMVSLALVTDPFGDYDEPYLKRSFLDTARPFKQHFVADLNCSPHSFIIEHHQRNARKALQQVKVERCQQPLAFQQDWVELYANLIKRHAIRGMTAFSETVFATQLKIPGLVMFRAIHEGVSIGMTLWYLQGKVGYYHLAAYNDTGYELRASFALFWSAFEYFASSGVRWLSLGAGAGVDASGADGLTRFKRGWSTGTRTAYFCGRIFQPERYAEICALKGVPATAYFPAYRVGEFA